MAPVHAGRWLLPLPLPGSPAGLCVVVGTPIDLGSKADPAPEEVEAGLARFIDAISKLFEKYKGPCGYPEATLEIL